MTFGGSDQAVVEALRITAQSRSSSPPPTVPLRCQKVVTSPKRHHVVPRFYLDRFARDGYLWVYDRERDEYRHQAPVNTAVYRHYYTFTDASGQRSTEVESMLARVEAGTKPILDNLDAHQLPSPEERALLASFAAFQLTRVPGFEHMVTDVLSTIVKQMMRTSFADVERAKASLRRTARSDKPPVDPQAMVDFVRDEAYELKINRNASLAQMLSLAIEIGPILASLSWVFVYTPAKKSYVTSDNPFTVIAPAAPKGGSQYGVGILTPGAGKFLPLGPSVALLMGDPGSATISRQARESLVRDINLAVTAKCERYVFAREERLLRNLVEHTNLANRDRPPRTRAL